MCHPIFSLVLKIFLLTSGSTFTTRLRVFLLPLVINLGFTSPSRRLSSGSWVAIIYSAFSLVITSGTLYMTMLGFLGFWMCTSRCWLHLSFMSAYSNSISSLLLVSCKTLPSLCELKAHRPTFMFIGLMLVFIMFLLLLVSGWSLSWLLVCSVCRPCLLLLLPRSIVFLINLLLTSMFHYKKQYYMLRGFLCNSSNSC